MSNYLDFMPEPTVNIVEATEYDLLNRIFLFENLSWSSGDVIINRIVFNEEVELFFNSDKCDVDKTIFNRVDISVAHSFGGNSYWFIFYLNNIEILYLHDDSVFGFAEDEVNQQLWDKGISELRRSEKLRNDALLKLSNINE